jgi:ribonuclease P protein component
MAAITPKKLRFGRKAHLKQGRDFGRVREHGRRLAVGCLIANWLPLEPGASSRLGVISSGKLGHAVVRNRARRLLRECYRLHQHDLAQPVDLVLVARNSIVGKAYGAVEKDFLTSLRKAGLLRGRSGA